jgi:hypothetical protein
MNFVKGNQQQRPGKGRCLKKFARSGARKIHRTQQW